MCLDPPVLLHVLLQVALGQYVVADHPHSQPLLPSRLLQAPAMAGHLQADED